MEIIFGRIALYDEVWTTPLTQLAKKYSLSDNGIREVCKAMNIPLPVAGHWAKVAGGKAGQFDGAFRQRQPDVVVAVVSGQNALARRGVIEREFNHERRC